MRNVKTQHNQGKKLSSSVMNAKIRTTTVREERFYFRKRISFVKALSQPRDGPRRKKKKKKKLTEA